jgi:tetratricopeptide (TPR) repeat protein
LGREEDAMDAINQITIDESSPARWHITKAEILDSVGRKNDAIEVYRKYLEINPTSAETLCMLSQTLVDAGKYEESLDFSKRLLALEPDHTHAYLDLTRSYLELGHKDEAVAFVHKLSEFSDKHSSKYLSYAAKLLADDGLFDDAIFAINAAIDIDSEEIDFLVIKAAMLLANDNAAEAIVLLNSARVGGVNEQRINNLWLAAHVSNSGFDGLSGALRELQEGGEADLLSLSWTGPFVELLEQHFQVDGPFGIATSVSRFLESVPVDGIDEHIAEALTEFCFDGLGVEVFKAEGWDRALPLLKEMLSDFESCSVVLDFLGVAVEYSSSRDEEVLLQLPVEQRELLLTAFNDPESD